MPQSCRGFKRQLIYFSFKFSSILKDYVKWFSCVFCFLEPPSKYAGSVPLESAATHTVCINYIHMSRSKLFSHEGFFFFFFFPMWLFIAKCSDRITNQSELYDTQQFQFLGLMWIICVCVFFNTKYVIIYIPNNPIMQYITQKAKTLY